MRATSPANPAEVTRLNNLGAAYMNQQLFEKGLKSHAPQRRFIGGFQPGRLRQPLQVLDAALRRVAPNNGLHRSDRRQVRWRGSANRRRRNGYRGRANIYDFHVLSLLSSLLGPARGRDNTVNSPQHWS